MTDAVEKTKSQIELKDKLHYETLRALALQGRFSFVISIANALIVYVVLGQIINNNVIFAWLLVVIGITLLRVLMIAWFFRLDEESSRLRSWQPLYLLLIYLSAAAWGVLPMFNEFFATAWSEAFIIFVIAGMSAGALVSLYAMLSATIPYLLIILLPLLYVLSAGTFPAHYAMALLTGLYLLLLVRSTYALNASVRKTLRLELENEELFDFLVNTRNEAQQGNAPLQDRKKFWQGYEI